VRITLLAWWWIQRALTLAINREELPGGINLPQDIPIVDAPYTLTQLRRLSTCRIRTTC
jgi:hypothetical protein